MAARYTKTIGGTAAFVRGNEASASITGSPTRYALPKASVRFTVRFPTSLLVVPAQAGTQ
jgi:hypothetical protein